MTQRMVDNEQTHIAANAATVTKAMGDAVGLDIAERRHYTRMRTHVLNYAEYLNKDIEALRLHVKVPVAQTMLTALSACVSSEMSAALQLSHMLMAFVIEYQRSGQSRKTNLGRIRPSRTMYLDHEANLVVVRCMLMSESTPEKVAAIRQLGEYADGRTLYDLREHGHRPEALALIEALCDGNVDNLCHVFAAFDKKLMVRAPY